MQWLSSLVALHGTICAVLCMPSPVCVAAPLADNADVMHVSNAAAMDPKYHRVLAPKLQEHANNYQLTDVSFR